MKWTIWCLKMDNTDSCCGAVVDLWNSHVQLQKTVFFLWIRRLCWWWQCSFSSLCLPAKLQSSVHLHKKIKPVLKTELLLLLSSILDVLHVAIVLTLLSACGVLHVCSDTCITEFLERAGSQCLDKSKPELLVHHEQRAFWGYGNQCISEMHP